MKVISIAEPYATLIGIGIKQIETRSWKTNYRGELYIHASAKNYPKKNKTVEFFAKKLVGRFHNGEIFLKCKLVGCEKMTEDFIRKISEERPHEIAMGFYEPNRYAWILEDVEAIEPIKAKGKLGIWNYEELKGEDTEQ